MYFAQNGSRHTHVSLVSISSLSLAPFAETFEAMKLRRGILAALVLVVALVPYHLGWRVRVDWERVWVVRTRPFYESWSVSFSDGRTLDPEGRWRTLWRRPQWHHSDLSRMLLTAPGPLLYLTNAPLCCDGTNWGNMTNVVMTNVVIFFGSTNWFINTNYMHEIISRAITNGFLEWESNRSRPRASKVDKQG
jgi:hypothetical protein